MADLECSAKRVGRYEREECSGPVEWAVVYFQRRKPHAVLNTTPGCYGHCTAAFVAEAPVTAARLDIERLADLED